jgi:hypothetical protein
VEGKRPISAAFDLYVIADADRPTFDHDRHDSGFHVGMPAAVSCHRSAQALHEPLDLDAWGSKTRDLDDRIVSQLQAGAGAKFNQVEIPRRDILAKLAPLYAEAERLKMFDELFLYKGYFPGALPKFGRNKREAESAINLLFILRAKDSPSPPQALFIKHQAFRPGQRFQLVDMR